MKGSLITANIRRNLPFTICVITEMGAFVHACEGEMVCSSTNATKVLSPRSYPYFVDLIKLLLVNSLFDFIQVPYFNAPIYLQNKSSIGKVDEILGPINAVYFTIKPSEGVQATSFQAGDKVYIGGDKILPLERFLPKPKPPPGTKSERLWVLVLLVRIVRLCILVCCAVEKRGRGRGGRGGVGRGVPGGRGRGRGAPSFGASRGRVGAYLLLERMTWTPILNL